MDYKLIFGLALCLIIGVLFVPAFFSVINGGATYGSEFEYMSLTANTPRAFSFSPLFSLTSFLRSNVSTSSNLVAGNIDNSLTKSFSTSEAVDFEDANLTINCQYDGDEDINFSLGGASIGWMGMLDTCPYTFTGIDGSTIGDPSTNLLMESSGSVLMEQGHNDTVALINDSVYVYFYTTKTAYVIPYDDSLHINITVQNPNLDLTEITYNGFNFINSTGNTQTTGILTSSLNANGSQRIKFLDLNGTAFEGSDITNVSWSYEYLYYESNFTNGTLTYDRWSAYPAANYSTTSTTISANHSGIYLASYVFGTSTNTNQMNLLSIVVALFVVFLMYIGIRELNLR